MSAEITITLPDGSQRSYAAGTTGTAIAADIGPGLAKAAMAMKVDGELRDLSTPIDADAALEIVTLKSDDETVLPLLRHDCAHVMAEAVQGIFPGTQVTIGPPIENGFYYDFARDEPFHPEDLERIEARMHEIVDRAAPFEREVWDRDEAIRYFTDQGEAFKAELIRDLPAEEEIRIYRQGEWLDLCRGPHMPTVGHVGHAFKLMKISGAYWRGDASRAQLQRIYGTAWRTEKELKAYLTMLEEAEKRDHRRIGREMGLFHIGEEAVGSVFWHPKGWTLYRTLERYMRTRLEASGYIEVKSPQLVDRSLWEASGHWEKFRENMFIAEVEEESGSPDYASGEQDSHHHRMYALKPMNCPCHVQIFKQGITSYRDLPIRMAEFGSCHRYEPSGALHGLMRVRAFTQDDAHIFCTEDQIASETQSFCELLASIYADLGFPEFVVRFADRPPVRAGEDAVWDRAEAALRAAAEAAGIEASPDPGEGAFYGPKLDFVLRDAIGRDWQCGTLQVDLVLPERLDASYVGQDGAKHRPVMLHRAILGSFERFTGILIEQYAGRFPLWLAPVQGMVATITSDADSYAGEVAEACRAAGLRVEVDLRNEKINYKVREHSLQRIPAILVVGKREADERTVALRRLGGKAQDVLPLAEAVNRLQAEARMPSAA